MTAIDFTRTHSIACENCSMRLNILAFFFAAAATFAAVTSDQQSQIDTITGAKGTYTASEDVHKVTFPRNDLKVSVDGRAMHPFMGLTSWAAFTSASGGQVMVMGDLTMAEDEVNAVMSVALDNGLEVTALHNHFFFDKPRIFFMHIGGHGTVEQMAGAVRKAIDQINAIRKARPEPAESFGGTPIAAGNSITAAPIEKILGAKPQENNGMVKIAIGRPARAHGHNIGNQMGVNTWAAFAGSDDNAFVDGDFAMRESELQGTLKALRKGGINVVAIHNHMSEEEPRYVFLHYWGKGKVADLLKGLRSALDVQK